MRFHRNIRLNQTTSDHEPPITKPVPMHLKNQPMLDESERLADLKMVAQRLGVSTRHVQRLVRRKVIPVIRMGRRCTRFDLGNVLTAVRRFEVQEVGRR